MTVFAGILALSPTGEVPSSARRDLRQLVSRTTPDHIEEVERPELHLVKLDLGVLSGKGILRDTDGSVAMLAGEPLYAPEGQEQTAGRQHDLALLHAEWKRRDWRHLGHCTGTYCAVMYDPATRSLALIADRFGVRPIYYWIGPDYIVFATALRILEGMADVPRSMNLRGVAEIVCFGFPLANRTAYQGIRTIREAEIVEVGPSEVRNTCYWHWDQLRQRDISVDELADLVYQRFLKAIQRRLGDDHTVAAFLSGGLDSRAIVAALRLLKVTVHTTNWAPPNSQDQVFGAEIAAVLGCLHQVTPSTAERQDDPYKKRGVHAWLHSRPIQNNPLERPGIVWSGDGGSVGLGHVYLNRAAVDELRTGRDRAAIEEFMRYNHLGMSEKVFRREWARQMGQFPLEGMQAELARLECEDPGRSLHLFLMFNDQRRHMAEHFENIDVDRIEFQMPFFDSHFLEPILAANVSECLRHVFYMEWLKRFPPTVTSVAWQAYPNHVPCPIPASAGLAYQWRKASVMSRQQRVSALRHFVRMACMRDFPSTLIDRKGLLAAGALTASGFRDYSHVLRLADVFCHYWSSCSGRFANA